jgi:hypothetical protein
VAKAPAFQFYVRDWLSDPQLRMCSHTTKGIWIDLLCLMWEAPERGKIEGTIEQLSRMVGANNGDFEHFLGEAESTGFCNANVVSVTHSSKKVTIVNRRMQREEKERKLHSDRQFRYRERHKDNLSDAESDAEVTVLSSSSSSSSNNKPPIVPLLDDVLKTQKPTKGNDEVCLPEWIDKQTWIDFVELRKKIRKPLTSKATSLIVKDLDRLRASGNDPTNVLEQSIKNCWQGVFALKDRSRKDVNDNGSGINGSTAQTRTKAGGIRDNSGQEWPVDVE